MKKILYVSLAFAMVFAGCKKSSDNSAAPATPVTPTITVEKKNRAILFDFSEDWCPPCGAYGGPAFDSCISLEVNTMSLMKVYTTSNVSSLNCSSWYCIKNRLCC